jgi:hypothetical protein
MPNPTPTDIEALADALDLIDGWVLYAQWADNVTVEEASRLWDAMSPADRGEWHRCALPFAELSQRAATALRELEAKRVMAVEALGPFAQAPQDYSNARASDTERYPATFALTFGAIRRAATTHAALEKIAENVGKG